MRSKILDEVVAHGVNSDTVCEVAGLLAVEGTVGVFEVATEIGTRTDQMYQPHLGVKKRPTQELVDWVAEVLEKEW